MSEDKVKQLFMEDDDEAAELEKEKQNTLTEQNTDLIDESDQNVELQADRDKLQEDPQKNNLKELLSWVIVIVVAVGAAVLLNCFVIINSVVPSGSMESTIMTGSRMFGFRLYYNFNEPERGDIIIFKYPDDESQVFVKRIIGLPGDTVEIIGGVTYINGEALDEPYLNETPNDLNFGPYQVPEDSYFVMGDNRNHSNDARYWQNKFVSRDKILAKALFCYWPFSRFGAIK